MWHMFSIQFFKTFSILEIFFQNFYFFCLWGPLQRNEKNSFFEILSLKKWAQEAKKLKIFKNISKIKKGFKNCILNMCHVPRKKIFLKVNILSFKKMGPRGVAKNIKFIKAIFRFEKSIKKWIQKLCVTLTKRRKK